MHALFRLIIVGILSAAVVRVAAPRATEAAPPQHSGCCKEMMKVAAHGERDCGGQKPKANQDAQCCAACAIGLALVLNGVRSVYFPPHGETLATESMSNSARYDRPPIPPPRSAIV
jgi:hypothetical protein